MKRLLFISFIFQVLNLTSGYCQGDMTLEEYIKAYKDTAIEEMKKHHIPASITLAQGILESGTGNSELARLANNHFGIKCHNDWTGKTFYQDDDEKDECFRRYNDAYESYQDHSSFLVSRDRYKFLFELDIKDYKGWANGLKQAGYATNPRYPDMLIRIIEENNLAQLDGLGGKHLLAGTHHKEQSNDNAAYGAIGDSSVATAPETFRIDGRGGKDRVLFINNGVKFILARPGDDFNKVAGEFGIYTWQVREYNELRKSDELIPGCKVYLERKKRKAEFEYHQVEDGETLYSISQDFGVRVNSIRKRNGLAANQKVEPGEIIKLK